MSLDCVSHNCPDNKYSDPVYLLVQITLCFYRGYLNVTGCFHVRRQGARVVFHRNKFGNVNSALYDSDTL